MTDRFVLSLSSPDATLARVGGKGANLAEMVRAGFPVPPGFLVTTDAYRAFVEANGLRQRILEPVQALAPEDPRSLEDASARIRDLFEEGRMPEPVARAIVDACLAMGNGEPDGREPEGDESPRLGPPPVAVRSSATAEDLPGLSFAGQHDSYLNVVGVDALLEAVKRCWGSLWTARAIGYRARAGITHGEVALAVVVQRMVPAEASGVLFTANPLTGQRDEIVVDAGLGLGEALVSGQIEPDHYVVNAVDQRIVERKVGAKALAVHPHPGGGTERVMREASREAALSNRQLLELAKLGQRVAERFGPPQDVEWALAEGRLHLLQSRPITALYPLPDLRPPDGPLVFVSANAIQGVTEPFTPLGRDVLQRLFAGIPSVLGVRLPARELIPEAGGRLFLNVTILVRDPRLRKLLLALLARADPPSRRLLIGLVEQGRIPTRRALTPGVAARLLRRLAPLVARAVHALFRPRDARRHALGEGDRFLAQVRERAAVAADLPALLEAMERDLNRAAPVVVRAMLPLIVLGIGFMTLVDRWLVRWLGERPGAALALMRGLAGNVTTEMDLKLWAAAQAIRIDPEARGAMSTLPAEELADRYRRGELPETARRAMAGFLEEYGMRAPGEIDLGRPRWRDDPAPLLEVLKGYLRLEDPNLSPDRLFRQGAAEAERLAGEYLARVRRTSLGAPRAWLLAVALRRMRLLGAVREHPKFYLIRAMDAYRAALLEHGRHMVARGRLERPEDLFFVSFEALRRHALEEEIDLRVQAAAGRTAYERELGRRLLPRVLLSTGEALYGTPKEVEGAAELVGDPVSPGVVEGLARVVLDPRGVKLEPGEILVCPATDPGWTPLFLTAGGLVMEMGGLVTHGSVVAREYGIPAVVGVHRATERLQTGQRVRVDGTLGRVTVVAEGEPNH